jgi:PAS domain S-box-containing protein
MPDSQFSGVVGTWEWDVATRQLTWSPEFEAFFGFEAGTVHTSEEFRARVHPDDLARMEAKFEASIRDRQPFDIEFRIVLPSGEIRWLQAMGRGVWDEGGRLLRVVGNNIVITERKRLEELHRRSEQRLQFLVLLNDALRPLSDPSDVQEAAARLLGEHLRVTRAGYAEVDAREYIIRREYASGVTPLVGQGPLGSFGAALRDAYARGETVVVTDVQSDPRFTEAERVRMQTRQIAAFIGVTLLKGGRVVAAFGVNHSTPRLWSPMEVELVRDVAERTWDAVERARAEAALREREHRLRLALDASGGGSWTWEASTNHIDWDDGFRLRYGFAPDEPATFEGWVSRVHEEDRARLLGFLEKVQQSTTLDAWDNTFRIVRPDGTVAWMQSRGRADRDVNGQLTRLTGLDLDITQLRRAEEADQARRDEERDREVRLLLETAAQGIVSVDAGGRIVTANRALETMFGWGRGELVGQSIERLLPWSVGDVHAQHRIDYFASPNPRVIGANRDLVGERKDGSKFPIEVSLNHVPGEGGGHAFAFVTDITERRRAAAALQERTVELERRTAQLSQLASDLTLAEQHAREQLAKTLHDGLQQLLLIATLNLDQQLKHDAQTGTSPAEHIVQAKSHLDEAIAAARSLSFELFPPVLQSSGLPAAITWLADWTRNKYGIEVQVSAAPLANSARKDVRTLLFESVRELLLNAVKHAHAERVSVDLAVDANGMLCITVTDQGIGFEPAEVGEPAKGGPAGWGLFSIRERLTLLGGRFDIESSPGHGARFRLIAPLGAQDTGSPQDPLSHAVIGLASSSATSPMTVHTLKILIVDDHTAVRRVFRDVLQERVELCVVGEASNGIEAIAQAHALRPDVILMDISMPQMDGVEATRRICAELPAIQILGLSMQVRTEARHPIEHAGASGFFIKGADTQRLIDHLLEIHGTMTARS